MMSPGTLYTISAPSGAGKTSLVNALVAQCPDIVASISYTTRSPRPGEQNGVNYHFVDTEQFIAMVNHGDFLEHARVFDNYYGTSKTWVQETLRHGQDVILEIDWQGALQIRRLLPESRGIFILPPSRAALRERLTRRGQDDQAIIAKRVAQAQEEMSHYVEADYLILNTDFDVALRELQAVIISHRLRLDAQQQRHSAIFRELLS